MKSFKDYAVRKPWGYEVEVFSNDKLAAWLLHIKKGTSTSLHCHPNKKTSLNVISGTVEISFLNSSLRVEAPYKCNIHMGVPHSTKALTNNVLVLETETPNNKFDLVRIRDTYDRDTYRYEGESEYFPRPIGRLEYEDLRGLGMFLSVIERHSVKFVVDNYTFILVNNDCLYDKKIPLIKVGDSIWGRDFSNIYEDLKLSSENNIDVITLTNRVDNREVKRLCDV